MIDRGTVRNMQGFIPKKKNKFEKLMHLKQSSPVTGLERPRGFQEVKVPRFRDNGTGWW